MFKTFIYHFLSNNENLKKSLYILAIIKSVHVAMYAWFWSDKSQLARKLNFNRPTVIYDFTKKSQERFSLIGTE